VTRPAAILLGAWVLLTNPGPGATDVPKTGWKKVAEYDAAWLCGEALILSLAMRSAYGDAFRCEPARQFQKETTPGPPRP